MKKISVLAVLAVLVALGLSQVSTVIAFQSPPPLPDDPAPRPTPEGPQFNPEPPPPPAEAPGQGEEGKLNPSRDDGVTDVVIKNTSAEPDTLDAMKTRVFEWLDTAW